jgi:hypothetical protein
VSRLRGQYFLDAPTMYYVHSNILSDDPLCQIPSGVGWDQLAQRAPAHHRAAEWLLFGPWDKSIGESCKMVGRALVARAGPTLQKPTMPDAALVSPQRQAIQGSLTSPSSADRMSAIEIRFVTGGSSRPCAPRSEVRAHAGNPANMIVCSFMNAHQTSGSQSASH